MDEVYRDAVKPATRYIGMRYLHANILIYLRMQ